MKQQKKVTTKKTNNLEYYRNSAGLTRAELAEMVNVDRTIIWRYEKGVCNPRDEVKIRISKALNKSVEEIFFSSPVVSDATKTQAS